MRLFGPLARGAAVATLVVGGTLAALPALAGPTELAMLESYVGAWTGSGQLTGARTDTLACKLTIKKATGEKVNFRGKCSVSGASISVNGTLAYNNASKRFEAAMSTSMGGYRGTAVGKKSGGDVVFNLRERAADDTGRAVTVAASITMNATQIAVSFDAKFNDSGETIAATMPFTR